MPVITIFIPTYRRPELLSKAIESVLNQTYGDLQVVISDNASGDETSNVIQRFANQDPRVQSICQPKNLGMLGNYNYCLSIIQTEYFSFLSDDDVLLPSFCETALAGFAQFPQIAFFASSTAIISQQKGVLRVPLDLWPREGLFEAPEGALQMIGKYPVPMTVLFRTKMAATATIDLQNPIAWDCDYLIQLASRFPIAISKKQTGIFLCHPSSFSGMQSLATTLQSIQRIQERVNHFTWIEKSVQLSIQELLKSDLRETIRRSLLAHLALKQFQKAKEGVSTLLCRPLKIKDLFFWAAIRALISLPPIRPIFYLMLKIRAIKRKKKISTLYI